jgi:mRNA deadenylase 3'-5' endonuclease subunit Ccr4
MSYNVLADELAHTHAAELYPRTPGHLLAWARRWALALLEIRHVDPDVLCLQVGGS